VQPRLSAGEAREQVDCGVLRKFLGPGVAINYPVDRDGDATLDEGPERRMLLRQFAEQLPDIFCLDFELLLASTLTGTDPLPLIRIDPASAH
jgi:hypothetical protein